MDTAWQKKTKKPLEHRIRLESREYKRMAIYFLFMVLNAPTIYLLTSFTSNKLNLKRSMKPDCNNKLALPACLAACLPACVSIRQQYG
jgi:hypothetical protein